MDAIAAALAAAVAWNVLTWARGLPASSGHALVGALVGRRAGGRRVDPLGRRGQDADRAGRLAAVRRARRAALDPRAAPGRAAGHAALARSGSRRGMGDLGGARLRPRLQRCAEVGRGDRRVARRRRARRRAQLAAVGRRGLRAGADARHGARRLADRAHDRPRDHPPAPARRCRVPGRRGGCARRRVGGRRARSPPRRWSPRRWSASAVAGIAGTTSIGGWCARSRSAGSSPCRPARCWPLDCSPSGRPRHEVVPAPHPRHPRLSCARSSR